MNGNGDIFDSWLEQLPENRKFSQTELPGELRDKFGEWMAESERVMDDGYDYVGAFLSGIPATTGHMPSFGRGMKLLKTPEHPTVWKTAFVEMVKPLTGKYLDPDQLGLKSREEAEQFILNWSQPK